VVGGRRREGEGGGGKGGSGRGERGERGEEGEGGRSWMEKMQTPCGICMPWHADSIKFSVSVKEFVMQETGQPLQQNGHCWNAGTIVHSLCK
jgi:hypothetical protein